MLQIPNHLSNANFQLPAEKRPKSVGGAGGGGGWWMDVSCQKIMLQFLILFSKFLNCCCSSTMLQIFVDEALITANYEDIKISMFHWLAVKLRLKEDDDLHTNNLWYSSKFIHSKVQTFHKIVLCLSHNLQPTNQTQIPLPFCNHRWTKSYFQNFESRSSLGRKVQTFHSLGNSNWKAS